MTPTDYAARAANCDALGAAATNPADKAAFAAAARTWRQYATPAVRPITHRAAELQAMQAAQGARIVMPMTGTLTESVTMAGDSFSVRRYIGPEFPREPGTVEFTRE